MQTNPESTNPRHFFTKISFCLFIFMYIKKDQQAFKTITRLIYFAKFVSRTFHFWGHLTIHYAGEICMCPLFPPFCSYKWREKDRSFVCALLFSVSRYLLKLIQDLKTRFGIHTKIQL